MKLRDMLNECGVRRCITLDTLKAPSKDNEETSIYAIEQDGANTIITAFDVSGCNIGGYGDTLVVCGTETEVAMIIDKYGYPDVPKRHYTVTASVDEVIDKIDDIGFAAGWCIEFLDCPEALDYVIWRY